MTTPTILIVLSEEQQAEYEAELDELRQPGLEFLVLTSPDVALDRVELFEPAAILVGMEVGAMEGLEFLALLMKRYPKLETPVIVVPAKGDPFPAVVHQRDISTGKSLTENIEWETVREMIATIKREAGIGSEPRIPVESQPALEAVPADASFAVTENTPAPPPTAEPPPGPAVVAPARDILAPTAAETTAAPSRRPLFLVLAVLLVLGVIAGLWFALSGGDEKVPQTGRAAPPDLTAARPATVPRLDSGVVDTPPAAPKSSAVDDRLRKLAALPLHFRFGKARFKPTANIRAALRPYKEALDRDPTAKIEVGGHTSDEGDAALNLRIGRQRAERVLRLLLKAGIAAKRIQIKSYGVSQPIATNDTDEGKQQNRRVTLRIIPGL